MKVGSLHLKRDDNFFGNIYIFDFSIVNMKKMGGYVISIVGLLIFVAGSKFFNTKAVGFVPLLESVKPFYLMVVGLAVVLVGIFFLARGRSGKSQSEVPIYKGKNIVGYRRHVF